MILVSLTQLVRTMNNICKVGRFNEVFKRNKKIMILEGLFNVNVNKNNPFCLEFLAQQTNAEIARTDVVIWVQTQYLTVVCEFNLSGLPLHLRQKKNHFCSQRIINCCHNLREHEKSESTQSQPFVSCAF